MSKSKLMERLFKATSVKGADIMSESKFFTEKDMIPTPLPILNIAFSGELSGGMTPGLTILAGESKTFKSALSLYCMKAYLDRYPDAVGVLYDTEFGVTNDYISSFGIDPSRVLHIPVEHIEELKFDFVKKLHDIERGDRVFFMVDSIGQISSIKEVNDANDEKVVADMSRAKAIRSLLRLITLQLTKKDIPCIMINHVYSEIGLFPKTVIPGGTSVTYSSNQIFVITKAQEKASTGELEGWNFTLNIFKSRFVREKAKLPFLVTYEDGIQKYSGILDLAIESGHVVKPSNGWYQLADPTTGEVFDGKIRAKDTGTEEFLGSVLKSPSFAKFVKDKYKLAQMKTGLDIDDEAIELEEETE